MIITNTINFAKINALGNKILVLEGCKNLDKAFTSLLNYSAFDQLMLVNKNKLEIYNNDKSLAGACGNGMRALTQYFYYKYKQKQASFITKQGRELHCEYINDEKILVNMGQPKFDAASLGLTKTIENVNKVVLDPLLPAASLVSVGNPHAVFFLNKLPDLEEICQIGPKLEKHPLFKDKCNISFAKIKDKAHIKLRTWERGAGLTQACGSAACATQIAAYRHKLCAEQTLIELLGGNLSIKWKPNSDIIMSGPSLIEFFGFIDDKNNIVQYE